MSRSELETVLFDTVEVQVDAATRMNEHDNIDEWGACCELLYLVQYLYLWHRGYM